MQPRVDSCSSVGVAKVDVVVGLAAMEDATGDCCKWKMQRVIAAKEAIYSTGDANNCSTHWCFKCCVSNSSKEQIERK